MTQTRASAIAAGFFRKPHFAIDEDQGALFTAWNAKSTAIA
jgi:beta-xylosidase